MPKSIPATLIALALAFTLGACAWLPPTDPNNVADSQTTTDTVYVDYWQTRDPSDYRQRVAGATNPQQAAAGTIRADCAKSIDENAAHGSDSVESATREISYFFKDEEICPRTR